MEQVEQRGQRAHTQLHAHMEDARDIPFIIKMSLPGGGKKTYEQKYTKDHISC